MVVLIVGALAFEWSIPIHHAEQSRLSRLVVAKPPAGFNVKPTSSAVVAASSNPFSAFKTAARRSPDQSGAYAIQWPGTPSSSTNSASVVVWWLPTASDAVAVLKQAVTAELAAGSFKALDNYSLERRFAIAGVPGAQAALFGPGSAKGNGGVAAAVVPEGRYVVFDFAQMTTTLQAQTAVTALAEAEDLHLRQVGPGFTLSETHWPLEASLICAGVTVALAALLVLVPLGASRGRRRQQLAREASNRRAVKGRGHKIASRQAARAR